MKDWLLYKILREFKNVLACLISAVRIVINDHVMDRRLGVKTDIGPERSGNDTSMYKDMHIYAATSYRVLRQVFDRIDPGPDDIFVDLGCGKGRAVFFASTRVLKKIIGIELDTKFFAIARENLSKLKVRKTPIEIIKADIATADILEGTIFFMFNPAGHKTIERVLSNILKSLETNSRKIFIAYYDPEDRRLFDVQERLVPEGQIGNTGVYLWRNK